MNETEKVESSEQHQTWEEAPFNGDEYPEIRQQRGHEFNENLTRDTKATEQTEDIESVGLRQGVAMADSLEPQIHSHDDLSKSCSEHDLESSINESSKESNDIEKEDHKDSKRGYHEMGPSEMKNVIEAGIEVTALDPHSGHEPKVESPPNVAGHEVDTDNNIRHHDSRLQENEKSSVEYTEGEIGYPNAADNALNDENSGSQITASNPHHEISWLHDANHSDSHLEKSHLQTDNQQQISPPAHDSSALPASPLPWDDDVNPKGSDKNLPWEEEGASHKSSELLPWEEDSTEKLDHIASAWNDKSIAPNASTLPEGIPIEGHTGQPLTDSFSEKAASHKIKTTADITQLSASPGIRDTAEMGISSSENGIPISQKFNDSANTNSDYNRKEFDKDASENEIVTSLEDKRIDFAAYDQNFKDPLIHDDYQEREDMRNSRSDQAEKYDSSRNDALDFLALDDDLLDDNILDDDLLDDDFVKEKHSSNYQLLNERQFEGNNTIRNEQNTGTDLAHSLRDQKNDSEGFVRRSDAYDFPPELLSQRTGVHHKRIAKYSPSSTKAVPQQKPKSAVDSTSSHNEAPMNQPSMKEPGITEKKSFFEELPVSIPQSMVRPARAGRSKTHAQAPALNPYNQTQDSNSSPNNTEKLPPPLTKINIAYGLRDAQVTNNISGSFHPSPSQMTSQPNMQSFPNISPRVKGSTMGHARKPSIKSPASAKTVPNKGHQFVSPYVPNAGPYAPSSHARKPSRASSLIGAKNREMNPYAPAINDLNGHGQSPQNLVHTHNAMSTAYASIPQTPVSPSNMTSRQPFSRNRAFSSSRGSLQSKEFTTLRLHDENAIRLKQFPIFSWSSSLRVAQLIPPRAFEALGASEDIKILDVSSLLLDSEVIASFPGPLIKGKTKKKDLEKWLELSERFLVSSPFLDQEILLINQVLALIVKHDCDLGSSDLTRAICSLLNPNLDYSDTEYIPESAHSMNVVPNAYKLDNGGINTVFSFIQMGQTKRALEYCVSKGDWALSLILAYAEGTQDFEKTVSDYARSVFPFQKSNNKVNHLMPVLLKILTGNCVGAMKDFTSVLIEGEWATQHWKDILVSTLINRNEKSVNFLPEFSKLLTAHGKPLLAQICLILSGFQYSALPSPVDQICFSAIGLINPSSFYSEIYEYILFNSPANAANVKSAHLIPLKLKHAQLLADYGYFAEARKYCDFIGSVIKSSPKGSVLNAVAFKEFQNLLIRISDSGTNGQGWFGGKISMVNLDRMWGQLDKFIGGDENESKQVEAGLFSKFSPSISRTNSSIGFPSNPTAPIPAQYKAEAVHPNDTMNYVSHALNGTSTSSFSPGISPSITPKIEKQSRPPMRKLCSTSGLSKYSPQIPEAKNGAPLTKIALPETTKPNRSYSYLDGQREPEEIRNVGLNSILGENENMRTDSVKSENYGRGSELISEEKKHPSESQTELEKAGNLLQMAREPDAVTIDVLNPESTQVDDLLKHNFDREQDNSNSPFIDKIERISALKEGSSVEDHSTESSNKHEIQDNHGAPHVSGAPPPRPQKPLINPYAPGSSKNLVHPNRKQAVRLRTSKYSLPGRPLQPLPGFNSGLPDNFPYNTSSIPDRQHPTERQSEINVNQEALDSLVERKTANYEERNNIPNIAIKNVSSNDDKEDIVNLEMSSNIPSHLEPEDDLPLIQAEKAENPMVPHLDTSPKHSDRESMFHPYAPENSVERRISNFGINSSFGDFSIPGSPEVTTRANSVLGGTGGLFSSRLSQSQQSALYQQYEVQDDTVKDYVPIIEEDEDSEEENKKEKEPEKQMTKQEKEEKPDSSHSRWPNWFKNKNNGKKPIRANLGEKNKLVYNEKLKTYIRTDIPIEDQIKKRAPPPPPAKKKVSESSQRGFQAPTKVPGVTPNNENAGDPSTDKTAQPLKDFSNAGVEDLLNMGGRSSMGATGRKSKRGTRRGYVNVFDQK